MKRRSFLKAIGLGVLAPNAMVDILQSMPVAKTAAAPVLARPITLVEFTRMYIGELDHYQVMFLEALEAENSILMDMSWRNIDEP